MIPDDISIIIRERSSGRQGDIMEKQVVV
jgi:hypothetical protein